MITRENNPDEYAYLAREAKREADPDPPRTCELTPRQIAAYNHARSHDLSKLIDKCWRCRWILWRAKRGL